MSLGDGTASCDVGAYELLPVPAAVEVPTLGAVGMIVLGTLLGLLGMVALAFTRRLDSAKPTTWQSDV